MLYDVCICIFPLYVDTRITRLISKSCPENEICYSYLLLPEDGSKEMIIKFNTRSYTNSSFVLYDIISNSNNTNYAFKKSCFIDSMEDLFTEESRYIHTCGINVLSPNQVYFFKVGYYSTNNEVILSSEKKFKTMDLENVVFSSGGHKSISNDAKMLIKESMKYSPSFIIIGGDLTYDNGFHGCYKRWDQFFREYEEIYLTPEGYSVPILTCPGNHEARDGAFWQTRNEIQTYIRRFSHSIYDHGSNASVYHPHLIGSHSSLLSLDSYVATSFQSQIPFIISSFNRQNYMNTRKFTLYHTPFYPSSRSYMDKYTVPARTTWAPLFDQFKVTVSFENHDHLFKRSKPLRNNTIVAKNEGTIYIGDGSLGIARDPVSDSNRWYLEYPSSQNMHIWMVWLNSTNALYKAISPLGKIIDEFTTL